MGTDPRSTPILLQEPRGDLIDACSAIAHIPEGSSSLRTRWKTNRSLDQGEEVFEQAVQLAVAHCSNPINRRGNEACKRSPRLAFFDARFKESR